MRGLDEIRRLCPHEFRAERRLTIEPSFARKESLAARAKACAHHGLKRRAASTALCWQKLS